MFSWNRRLLLPRFFLSSGSYLNSIIYVEERLLDLPSLIQNPGQLLTHKLQKTWFQLAVELLEKVLQLFQLLLPESIKAGTVEGPGLCKFVDVKVSRFYQHNNQTWFD